MKICEILDAWEVNLIMEFPNTLAAVSVQVCPGRIVVESGHSN